MPDGRRIFGRQMHAINRGGGRHCSGIKERQTEVQRQLLIYRRKALGFRHIGARRQ